VTPARHQCIAGHVAHERTPLLASRPEGGRDGGTSGDDAAGRGQGVVINISSVMGRVAGRGSLAYGTAKAALDIVLTNEELRERMERATPLGRIGDPEDIAAAVLFPASPAGGHITG
jgi:NAD(P)-dependent dehydrogenase (short-subunit alcohol dehydrogenase family)